MSEELYQEGDTIKAVKGKSAIEGELQLEFGSLSVIDVGWDIDELRRQEFTITITEKAKPRVVLPTREGIYADKDGDVWRLRADGYWVCLGLEQAAPKGFAPFTRLAPVTEVLGKLIDMRPGLRHRTDDARVIADLYGVTL